MMVIEYKGLPGGLMIHFQIPFGAEKSSQGRYSIGPNDGSLLCPVHREVAAALISKATEINVYPDGTELYLETEECAQ